MIVTGQQQKIKVLGVRFGKDGNPIITQEEAIKYWDVLSTKVKIYCKEKYSLDLEI